MQQYYQSTGTDPFTTTPAELAKFQAAESAKWKAVIGKAGIEPE
jgi:tripartite-type tricarboxylate transporter receptor subunit TctC